MQVDLTSVLIMPVQSGMGARQIEYKAKDSAHMSGVAFLKMTLCTFSSPTGIRTPVAALKGLSPSPLDDGAMHIKQGTFYL